MPTACPAEQALLAFHLGKLALSEIDAVADHLEGCAACAAALRRLDGAADPVLEALRRPAPLKPTVADGRTPSNPAVGSPPCARKPGPGSRWRWTPPSPPGRPAVARGRS